MVVFASLALTSALATAAAAETQAQSAAAAKAESQARATVTILAAAELKFSELEKSRPEQFRETIVRSADGSTETIELVEFQ